MGEMGDDWREHKKYLKKQKEKYDRRVWPVIEKHLQTLREMGYSVRSLTSYQYRINGVLDIYPENMRYHDVIANKRGDYRNMVKFVIKFFTNK